MILLPILIQKKTNFLLILSFTVSGLLLRLFLFDSDGLQSDGLLYYKYAYTIAFEGKYPENSFQLHNLGWVFLLVPFFKLIGPYPETLSFAQHMISIAISTATIPLSFIFAKRFLPDKYAIFVPLLFCIDFRMAQNATFGIIEPLSMILALAAYSVKNRLLMFIFVGLACAVRFEAIMLIPVLFIIHKDKKLLPYVIIPVFILALLFVGNSSVNHSDQFVAKVNHEMMWIKNIDHPNSVFQIDKITNSIVYMVWAAFPTFVLSVFGMWRKPWIILTLFILSISGLWAYLDAYDTRYFFPMYPFLALACAFGFQHIMNMKNIKRNEDNK